MTIVHGEGEACAVANTALSGGFGYSYSWPSFWGSLLAIMANLLGLDVGSMSWVTPCPMGFLSSTARIAGWDVGVSPIRMPTKRPSSSIKREAMRMSLCSGRRQTINAARSEEHTSELQ